MTEWDEFRKLCSEFKVMRRPLVVDGRNMIQCEDIEYVGGVDVFKALFYLDM